MRISKNAQKISKKAQGLPMTTIVIIILVIIVLVAVVIFFFTGFGESQKGIAEQTLVSKCQTACAKIQAGASCTASDYCDIDGEGTRCDFYISCEDPDGGWITCPCG